MHAKRLILSLILIATNPVAFANPDLPVLDNISAGHATVQATDTHVQINQQSSHAAINWHSFNIADGKSVHFQQPANGIALNRVDPTQGASQIAGKLSATGRIIISNPAGIHFSSTAKVDVAGLIATTGSISDRHFLANKFYFEDNSRRGGSVTNAGEINATEHGFVAFIAPHVQNTGKVTAHLGQIFEFSSSKFILQFSSNNLIHFVVDDSMMSNAIRENHFIAENGNVYLQPHAAKKVLDKAIHIPEGSEARSVYEHEGKIILSANHEAPVPVVQNKKLAHTEAASSIVTSDADEPHYVMVSHADLSPRETLTGQTSHHDWLFVNDPHEPLTSPLPHPETEPDSLSPHTLDRTDSVTNSLLSMSLNAMAQHLGYSDLLDISLSPQHSQSLNSPLDTQAIASEQPQTVPQTNGLRLSRASSTESDFNDTIEVDAADLSDAYDSDSDEFIAPHPSKIYKIQMAKSLFDEIDRHAQMLAAENHSVIASGTSLLTFFMPNTVSPSVIAALSPHIATATSVTPAAAPLNPSLSTTKLNDNGFIKSKFAVHPVLYRKNIETPERMFNAPFASIEHKLYLMMTPFNPEHWAENFQNHFMQ